MEIFLSFDIPDKKEDDSNEAKPIKDRFTNKDQNFSITWYSSFNDYYNEYLQDRLELMNMLTNKGQKSEIEDKLKKQA